MSARRLRCDAEGCDALFPSAPEYGGFKGLEQEPDLRGRAAKVGWSARGDRDLCPEHGELAPLPERLYGLPGAEHMHTDVAAAYDADIDPDIDWFQEGNRPALIEEWSVCDAGSHVPPVEVLMDYMVEWVGDRGLLDEEGFYAFENSAKRPDVLAAFQSALDLWASKVTYRMADKHLRTFTITWDENEEPLVDGEPLYGNG